MNGAITTQNLPQGWRRALRWALFAALITAGILAAVSPAHAAILVGIPLGLTVFVFCATEERVKYALFAVAIYLPFEEFLLKWVPENIFLFLRFAHFGFLAGCLAVILMRSAWRGTLRWRRTPIDVPLAFFLIFSLFSLIWNEAPLSAGIISYQTFLRFIALVFYLLHYASLTKRDVIVFTVMMCVIALLQCAIAMAQSVIGPAANEFLAPVGGEFGDYIVGGMTQELYGSGYQVFATLGRYNVLAMFLVIFILITAPFYGAYRRVRPALNIFYPVAGFCLILTAARGPWLALVAGVWVIFALRGELKAVVMPLLAVTALFLLLTVYAEQVVFVGSEDATALERLLELFTAKYYTVMSNHHGRLYYAVFFPFELLSLDFERFVWGFGPGMVGPRAIEIFDINALEALGISDYDAKYVVDVYWAYILAQAGILALGCLVWMFYRLGGAVWRIERVPPEPFVKHLAQGCLGVLAATLVAACFTSTWEIRPIAYYVWFYAAAALRLGQRGTYSGAAGKLVHFADTV